jgi:hypothetical protein
MKKPPRGAAGVQQRIRVVGQARLAHQASHWPLACTAQGLAMRSARRTFHRAPACFRRRPTTCSHAPSTSPLPINWPAADRPA